MWPLKTQVLTPATYKHYFTRKRGLCRCDSIKGLDMESLPWIIWVSPKSNHMCPFKRERFDTHREEIIQTEAEIGVMWPQAREC